MTRMMTRMAVAMWRRLRILLSAPQLPCSVATLLRSYLAPQLPCSVASHLLHSQPLAPQLPTLLHTPTYLPTYLPTSWLATYLAPQLSTLLRSQPLASQLSPTLLRDYLSYLIRHIPWDDTRIIPYHGMIPQLSHTMV